MDVLKSGCSLCPNSGNLNPEDSFELFEGFFPMAKIENSNPIADLKPMYVNNVHNNMSNPIEEGLDAYGIGDSIDGFILKREGFPIEELRNAFEAELKIDGAEKPDYSGNQADEVRSSFKNEKEQWHKGFSKSPIANSVMINDESPQIEQGKPFLDSGELMMHKSLVKCATFQCSVHLSVTSLDESNEKASRAEIGIVDSKQSPELKNASYGRTLSLPSSIHLISAMRGGQEQSGLGPRPKLSVKWAPDVQEPQLSSVSHTVKSFRQFHSRKKDKKHKHKGKSSNTSESNKSSKKRHSKRSYNSERIHSRLQSSAHGNSILLDVWASRNSVLVPVKTELMGLGVPIFDLQTGQEDITLSMSSKSCGEGGSDLLAKGFSDVEFPSRGFKCASSVKQSIQNKHLSCTEAA